MFPCKYLFIVDNGSYICIMLSHVYRNRPQPQLPSRHPPPRRPPARQQSAETHLGQPLRLAQRKNRKPPPPLARRTPGLSPGSLSFSILGCVSMPRSPTNTTR